MAVPARPDDKKQGEQAPYRLGGMGYQDASGRRLSYSSYLRLQELLDQQRALTQAHDELLFIVAHQVYELWFKVVLHELEAVREAISRKPKGHDFVIDRRHHLAAVPRHMSVTGG